MALILLPVVKSLILCEDVLPGPAGTGNVHLMNVFGSIRPATFPHRHRQFCVFLQLVDAVGTINGRVVVSRAETDEARFFTPTHPIPFLDRLQVK
jgi:hypothetical protein